MAAIKDQPKYKPGQIVFAWHEGKYRQGEIVTAGEWYSKGNCYGYYVDWRPTPVIDPVTGITPSIGGWKPEHYLKGDTVMINVCTHCEKDIADKPATICDDCGAEYHQRCWDALDECKGCAEQRAAGIAAAKELLEGWGK